MTESSIFRTASGDTIEVASRYPEGVYIELDTEDGVMGITLSPRQLPPLVSCLVQIRREFLEGSQ